MAELMKAMPALLRNEGGYSNVEGDTGGETYRGISRNNFPNWKGWAIVDRFKPLKDEQIISDDQLDILIHIFYNENFWATNKLEKKIHVRIPINSYSPFFKFRI